MTKQIDIVGGPLHGKRTDIPRKPSVVVGVKVPGEPGFCQFSYTLRRCRNAAGEVVECWRRPVN